MRHRGTALAMVIAVTFVIVIIGIASFFMIQLFGGARELQSLTDSGTLNIGKGMIVVGVPLDNAPRTVSLSFMNYNHLLSVPQDQPASIDVKLNLGIEASNFSYLTDSNGNISLQNYNRVIAQAMLVGLNAQAENTIPAIANAHQLFDAVQRNADSLSARLCAKLTDPTAPSSLFANTGMSNSLRMLRPTGTAQFVTQNYWAAYNSPNSPTNVWLDPSILPAGITVPAGAVTSVTGPSHYPYLSGYVDIDTGPFAIQGTPVFPGQQPHMISLRDLQAAISPPLDLGYVAPNSFGATAVAPTQFGAKQLKASSASVVSTMTTEYPACIPGGYLVIQMWGGPGGTLPYVLSPLKPADQQKVMDTLVQRIRQIKPTLSVNQVQTFLSNVITSQGNGPPTYIYQYPDPKNPLYSAWHGKLVSDGAPEGVSGDIFASFVPPPSFPIVDPATAPPPAVPQHSMSVYGLYSDGPMIIYKPDPNETWWPKYHCDWAPSSGYDNLLGVLIIP